MRSTHRTKAEEMVVAESAAKVAQMPEMAEVTCTVKVPERAVARTEVGQT